MSTSQPPNGAQAAALKRLPTSSGLAPTTPSASFNLMPTVSTPQSYATPAAFISPAARGTPRKGMVGQKTFGGAVTGLTPNPCFNFSFGSPPNNFASPNMLNMDGIDMSSTPAASGLALGAFEGGTAMGLTLSNLGINMGTSMSTGGSTGGKVDDAERRRRLLAVLETIGKKKGRLSRDAIKRLGRRYDLVPEEAESMKLSLAGKAGFVVDVWFEPAQPDTVSKVVLELMTPFGDAVKGAEVLQYDLTLHQNNSTFGVPLENFADNLSRLATIDKLGEDESPTCFAAISGIYSSLRRLYEHERRAIDTIYDDIDMHVLRKKSGRPSMHERRRIGLSMDYWMKRGSVRSDGGPSKRSRVDHDTVVAEGAKTHVRLSDERDICSLTIECEQLPPGIYPPIQISNGWISERVEKPEDDIPDFELMSGFTSNSTTLDWLDPPIDQVANDGDEISSLALTVQPVARFVARLEPPIAIPYHIATQLYASIQTNITQVVFPASESMTDLMLPSIQSIPLAGDTPQLHQMRKIGADNTAKEFQLGLYWSNSELGVLVGTLPFDHPRRLVEALPVLRQYAFIARLLQNTFPRVVAKVATSKPPTKHDIRKMRMQRYKDKFSQQDMEAELAALLAPKTTSVRALDLSLVTTPVPQMTLSLASKQGLKKMTFNIKLNADIEIVSQNIVADGGDELIRQKQLEGLKTALEMSEDLGIWGVWVRRTYLDEDE